MTLLLVTWGPDQIPDPRPVRLTRSWLPILTGHHTFVLGRTIRTRYANISPNHMRHELTHVRQQAGIGVLRFLWRYYLCGMRGRYEQDAHRAENAAWPQWVSIGNQLA